MKKPPLSPSGAHQRNQFANWPVADSPDRKTPVAEPPRSLARDGSILEPIARARRRFTIGFWTAPTRVGRAAKGGEMGKGRTIWRGALVTASVAIGVFLAACSHDPVTPAPVYMGAARVTDTRSAAPSWPQPAAGAAETRRATAAPAPLAGRTAQTEHASRRPIMAGNHPTRAQKKMRARLATRHAAAPRKQATIYPVPARTATPSAGGETIPLDGPAASTAWPPAVPPGSATSPERTNSSRVSPPPGAEPTSTEPQRVVR